MKWFSVHTSDITDAAYAQLYADLSPSRKARVDRQKQADARRRTLAGEWLMRRWLDENGLCAVRPASAENGRPYLPATAWHVSVAHCDELVVCAVSEAPIGIDVERIRPIDLKLARRVCVEEELIYLFGRTPTADDYVWCEDPDILTRFFEIWTAKEAHFKRCGTGITTLQSVNILPLKRQIFHQNGFLIQIIDE